jgi:hypothetical protein
VKATLFACHVLLCIATVASHESRASSFPFQAALKEAGAKALELIEGFPRIAAKSKACDGGGTTDGNRCGYPICVGRPDTPWVFWMRQKTTPPTDLGFGK